MRSVIFLPLSSTKAEYSTVNLAPFFFWTVAPVHELPKPSSTLRTSTFMPASKLTAL